MTKVFDSRFGRFRTAATAALFGLVLALALSACGGGRGSVTNPIILDAPNGPDPLWLTVEYGDSVPAVTLRWTAPATTNRGEPIADPALLQYRVYRSDNGGPYRVVAGTAATVFFDADSVDLGSTYGYYVRAVDSREREGDRSAIQTARPALTTGPSFRGNPANTGLTAEAVNPPLEPKWTYSTAVPLTSSPTVAQGRVFVGDHAGVMTALDAETGEVEWTYATGASIASTPAVEHGKVVFGSADYNVYALDAETGVKVWEFAARGMVAGAPSIAYGIVYIGAGNPTAANPGDTSLYALDLGTGAGLWAFETGDAVVSCPAVSNGIAYFGSTDWNVYALDAFSGGELWRFPTGGAIVASPAVMDGRVYIGSTDDYMYAISAQAGPGGVGALVWQYRTPGDVGTSAALGGGVVYIGSASSTAGADNQVLALDAAGSPGAGTTTRLWFDPSPDGNEVWASPTSADGGLIAATGSPTTFRATERVYILDPSDGSLLWQRQLGAPALSPVFVDGTLYVATLAGTLTAFE